MITNLFRKVFKPTYFITAEREWIEFRRIKNYSLMRIPGGFSKGFINIVCELNDGSFVSLDTLEFTEDEVRNWVGHDREVPVWALYERDPINQNNPRLESMCGVLKRIHSISEGEYIHESLSFLNEMPDSVIRDNLIGTLHGELILKSIFHATITLASGFPKQPNYITEIVPKLKSYLKSYFMVIPSEDSISKSLHSHSSWERSYKIMMGEADIVLTQSQRNEIVTSVEKFLLGLPTSETLVHSISDRLTEYLNFKKHYTGQQRQQGQ